MYSAALLCDQMMEDDRIAGVLKTRVSAVLGLDVSMEYVKDSMKEGLEQDLWKMFPEAELSQLIKWGLLLGVGVGNRTIEKDKKTGRWVPKLRNWDPSNLTHSDEYGWRVKVKRKSGFTEYVPCEEQDGWVLYRPYGDNHPWKQGIWRTVGLWWVAKDRSGLRAWAQYNNNAQPMMVGKLPEGVNTNDAGARKFFTLLKALGSTGRAVLPDGWSLDLLDAKVGGSRTFGEIIDTANAAIAISILGQPLTTEVKDSINTGATAAAAVRQDYLEYDAEVLSTWYQNTGLKEWADWNYAEEAPYPKLVVERPMDLTGEATRAKLVGEAAGSLATNCPSFDMDAFLAKFGIPVKGGRAESEVQISNGLDIGHLDNSSLPQPEALKEAPEDKVVKEGQAYLDKVIEAACSQDHLGVQNLIDAIDAIPDDEGNWQDRVNQIIYEEGTKLLSIEALAKEVEGRFEQAGLAGGYVCGEETDAASST
jgi:hypothetical protein